MASPHYIVEGGHKLSGTIRPSGNKNAALPIIAAALLTDQPVTLENVPRIRDVETLVELVLSLGVKAEWSGRNTLAIHARDVRASALDPALCARIRASILLAAPLLARCGAVTLPPPGGNVIGRRRVDTHFLALEQLGAKCDVGANYDLSTKGLKGADVFLDEPSVTATENALMAAAAASGRTILRNAASEPHVQDLANFLVALGARIGGIGTNEMTIEGAKSFRGATHRIGPDHIEVGSFIGLAAVTNSAIRIEDAGLEHLRSVRFGFERLGVVCQSDGTALVVPAGQDRGDPQRPRRPRAEARGPTVARVPGRPHVDRDRDGHAVQGADPDAREDVRIAALLRGQTHDDGRAHRAVRSASRAGRGAVAAARGDARVARHPRGHGDAARGALRGRDEHHQ